MPASEAEVAIILSAVNKASAQLQAVQKDLAGLGSAAKEVDKAKASVSQFGNVLGQVQKGLLQGIGLGAGLGIAQLVSQLPGATMELARTGARILEVGDAFRTIVPDAERMLAALRRTSGGTITEMDLMLSANRAAMLGIGTNIEQMSALMEVARFRARAFGMDTSQAFSDIVTGIGRMSPLILDNLGIIIDGERTFGEYAASIGKAADQLTAAEKRQALLNETLRVGQTQIREAGGVADNAADSFRRMDTAIKGLKESLGMGIAPVIADIIDAITRTGGVLQDPFQKQLAALVSGFGPAVSAFFRGENAADAFGKAVVRAAGAMDLLTGANANWLALPKGGLERQFEIEGLARAGKGGGPLMGGPPGMTLGPITPMFDRKFTAEELDWIGESYEAKGKEIVETGEEASKAYSRAWESAADTIQSRISQAMAPSFAWGGATDILDQLGLHEPKWDEWARRAAAVVSGGTKNEWYGKMVGEGMLPGGLDDAGAKAAAARWIDAFYAGAAINVPGAVEGIAARYNELMQAEMGKEQLSAAVMAKLGGPGAVNAEMLKKAMGDKWVGVGGDMVDTFGKEMEANKKNVETAAGKFTDTFVAAALKAGKDSGFAKNFAGMLLPALTELFDQRYEATHAGAGY